MATTRDVIRYNISTLATAIYNIKLCIRNSSTPRIFAYINPKDPSWARYRQLKREASIWLTMLSLVKAAANERPDVVVHSRATSKRIMFSKANKRLRRLAYRLEKNPGKYTGIDAWVATKKADMAKRNQEVQLLAT